jgi:hypothetical protein
MIGRLSKTVGFARIQDTGYRIQDTGYRIQDSGAGRVIEG